MNIGDPSRLLLAFSFAAAFSPAFAACAFNPTDLQCEFRSDPSGLGEKRPRLDWRLEPAGEETRGLSQTAYQVLVASTPDKLAHDEGDLWASGKVVSDRTSQIEYDGAPLASRAQCWWKIRVWDQAGQLSAWSRPAHWTMGLLEASDWSARWIGLDAAPPADRTELTEAQRRRIENLTMMQAPLPESPTAPLTVLVRRGFTLPAGRQIARVTLVATPDQRCAVSVNGRKIVELDRWEQVAPLDLTAAVAAGDNVLGLKITQEDGYPPAVQGELEIDFADGGLVRLPVDATWHYAVTAPAGWDSIIRPEDNWKELVALPHHYRLNQFHELAPAPCLRRSFTVAKPVRRAMIYTTALGDYELRLNGSRVGRDYLTPGWTDYSHRVPFQAYDVTALLGGGRNALGAILGDGWYAGTMGNVGRRYFYGGYPRFLAQLEIEYTDGTQERVVTDGSWHGAFGPIRYADNLQGYSYDGRREFKDWTKAGFDESSWSPVAQGLRRVAPGPAPHFVLEADTIDPVRISDELPAKSVAAPAPGVALIDFGQNLAGWVRLRVSGRPGQKVTIRHGEALNPNGTLYTSNLRGANATDTYWLRGGGEETLEPRFTFHGFRYAEITGLDSAPAAAAATAIVVGTPLQRTGEFSCSDPLLNQLFHNIIWSQKSNYLETPTDCPQRDERLGWSGDEQFFIRTGAFNFNVAVFTERWLQAMRDGQGEEGKFYDVAPAVTDSAQKAITAWSGDAAVICTEALWRVYGDRRAIERNYDALDRYLGWLEVSNQHGMSSVGGYGDWVNLGGGAKPEVMDTAYYSYLCGLMSEMAAVIGRPADAVRFAERRKQVIATFQQAFLQPDGSILDSSQTAYALAFTMDLLPEAARAKAAEKFVGEISSRNWHLATGFIGTPRLLPALHLAGRDDVAYRLLLQDTFPSWIFTIKNGATTMWERWDGWTPDKGFESIGMNSFNHYAFGAVGEFLYRFVGGIDTDGPGFHRILIQPRPGGTLTEAQATYDAITGRIESGWKIDGDRLLVDAVIPPNTTATVSLPVPAGTPVLEGGRPVAESPGIKSLGADSPGLTFLVGSGSYHFAMPRPPAPEVPAAGAATAVDPLVAIHALGQRLADQEAAVTAARAALLQASVAETRSDAEIRSQTESLHQAELALVDRRSEYFALVGAHQGAFGPEQRGDLVQQGLHAGMPDNGRAEPAHRAFHEPDPIDFGDHAGFTQIFDGATLRDWDGDPTIWRVENGAIVGVSTREHPVRNSYISYHGAVVRDFDLKLELKVTGRGGSGIQYRSAVGLPWRRMPPPGTPPPNLAWMMTGPQADFWPAQPIYSGQFYSENTPLGIVAWRGQVVSSVPGEKPRLVANIGNRTELGTYVKNNDWNQYEVIARGATLVHIINGRLMAVEIDDDPASSNNAKGLIGIEIESFPCVVSARNIWLRSRDLPGETPK